MPRYSVELIKRISTDTASIYSVVLDGVDLYQRAYDLAQDDAGAKQEITDLLRFVAVVANDVKNNLVFREENEHQKGKPLSNYIYGLPPQGVNMRFRLYCMKQYCGPNFTNSNLILGFIHRKHDDEFQFQQSPCLYAWIKCLQAIESHIFRNLAEGFELEDNGDFAGDGTDDMKFDIFIDDSFANILNDCNKIE